MSEPFLPPEKAAPEEVERQHRMLAADLQLCALLDGMQNLAMVLNTQRQAVYLNKAFREFMLGHGVKDPVGLRHGELAGCRNAKEGPGGCGTSEACRYCGAAQAVAATLQGCEAKNECRITSVRSGDDLDLRVLSRPFKYSGESFMLVSLTDISADKRRHVLERLFFHDILNTAGGVQGLITLMESASQDELKQYLPPAVSAAERMIEQIQAQKDLAAAENGDLQPKLLEFDACALAAEVAGLLRAHEVGQGRDVRAECAGEPRLTADRTMLSRVLGNLVKNALEAEPAGSYVKISCATAGGKVLFKVFNPKPMPEEVMRQVFQRSFSTKGAGRGLGTYSVRLLTERYLKGRVYFTSGQQGTEFGVELPERP